MCGAHGSLLLHPPSLAPFDIFLSSARPCHAMQGAPCPRNQELRVERHIGRSLVSSWYVLECRLARGAHLLALLPRLMSPDEQVKQLSAGSTKMAVMFSKPPCPNLEVVQGLTCPPMHTPHCHACSMCVHACCQCGSCVPRRQPP